MTPRFLRPLVAAVALLLGALAPAYAQEDAECLRCHGNPEAKPAALGGRKPPIVDMKAFAASVHGGRVQCIHCHQDLDGAEFPHKAKLAPANCADCHDPQATQHAESRHGKALAAGDPMAPLCRDCHGGHDVQRHKDPASKTYITNIPLLCGQCHHEGSAVSRTHDIPQDKILENYSGGMHGAGLFEKGLIVTAVCTTCHTSHEIRSHDDPKSSIHPANLVKTCLQCHAQIERVHRKVIDGKLWESEPNKIPVCVDCHQPHKTRRPTYPTIVANKDCLGCHGKPDLTGTAGGQKVSLFVDAEAYAKSTHGKTGCAQCHSKVDPSRQRACETLPGQPVDCSACHAGEVGAYRESTHGQLSAKHDADAPVCLDCHSKHATMSRKDPKSPTYPRNIPNLCGKCHREGEKAAVRIRSEVPDIVGSYSDSVHGEGLTKSGLIVSATCVSCHSSHRELGPADPRSTVHPTNLASTCGACHAGVEEKLRVSAHWPGNVKTDRKLPTCKDCHTAHRISRTSGSEFRIRVIGQCGECHEREAATYFDTFHGKMTQLGGGVAAKCFNCHGTHDVRQVADAASRISPANIVATCGQCHEGSHEGFAAYMPHGDHSDPKQPWLYWTYRAMTGLLLGTMGAAALHTVLWLLRLLTSRKEWAPHRAKMLADMASGRARLYRRFTPTQSMTHIVLVASFLTLALTGMALKFGWMSWGAVVSKAFGGFERMGMLHRIAAVILLGLFTFHIWHLATKRKEWGWTWKQLCLGPESMMFGRRDGVEFVETMKWFFGRGPRPRYGRFTYWEKFDYFAVFWGVVIIGTSGLMLWFPTASTHIVPGWALNVASIVHGDEALLAVAFIFTVHFFNTQFRPDRFPMDVSIFTGMITVEELEFERPRELEALRAAGTLEEHIVPPPPAHMVRGIKVLAGIALVVGLALVFGIVRALLSGRP